MTIINHELEALVIMIDRSHQAVGLRSTRETTRAETTSFGWGKTVRLRRPGSAMMQRRWSQKAAMA
jgi:hypothetical protein